MIIKQFVAGLPREFAHQLRMNSNTTTISDCIEFVRQLRGAESALRPTRGLEPVAAAGDRHKSTVCFKCQKPGHIARNRHTVQSPSLQGASAGSSKALKYFFCDELGHMKKDCPEHKKRMCKNYALTFCTGTHVT